MHEKIYEAIARSDIRAAKLAMEEHVQDIIDKNNPAFQANAEAVQRRLTETELAYSV
jgi:DNA-binding FadR family transcriptional regulator